MKRKDMQLIAAQQARLIEMQFQTMNSMSQAIANLENQTYNLIRTVQELAHEDVSQRRMTEIRHQFPRQQ